MLAKRGGGCGAGLQITNKVIILREIAPGILLALVRLDALRDHEMIMPDHLEKLRKEIERDGAIRKPILVDKNTLTILDGHHRVNALRIMDARWVPAILVDYYSDKVKLSTWRPGINVSKTDVVRRALKGELFPPKTTRHIVLFEYPNVNLETKILMDSDPRGRIRVRNV